MCDHDVCVQALRLLKYPLNFFYIWRELSLAAETFWVFHSVRSVRTKWTHCALHVFCDDAKESLDENMSGIHKFHRFSVFSASCCMCVTRSRNISLIN